MLTLIILLAIGGTCVGVAGLIITLVAKPRKRKDETPKLTEARQQQLILEMDDWRERVINRATSDKQLDEINNYYEMRRSIIEKGLNPAPIPQSMLDLANSMPQAIAPSHSNDCWCNSCVDKTFKRGY